MNVCSHVVQIHPSVASFAVHHVSAAVAQDRALLGEGSISCTSPGASMCLVQRCAAWGSALMRLCLVVLFLLLLFLRVNSVSSSVWKIIACAVRDYCTSQAVIMYYGATLRRQKRLLWKEDPFRHFTAATSISRQGETIWKGNYIYRYIH